MPRIRTIKPEMWADEKLAPLAPIHRLVFVGLISQADDGGRLVDQVRLLDGLLFPMTEESCADSLEILAELGLITRYTAPSGQRLIQISGWTKHQKVDRPSKHQLPPPPCDTPPSRDPRETLATGSRDPISPTLDLGPRTNDLGPGTDDLDRGGSSSSLLERVVEEVGEEARADVVALDRRFPLEESANGRRGGTNGFFVLAALDAPSWRPYPPELRRQLQRRFLQELIHRVDRHINRPFLDRVLAEDVPRWAQEVTALSPGARPRALGLHPRVTETLARLNLAEASETA